MCKCTPEMRTPFCGKPGCEWPPTKAELDAAYRSGYAHGLADGQAAGVEIAKRALERCSVGYIITQEPIK